MRPWPKPFLTQAEIDDYESGLLDIEREMRMRGAWSTAVAGRWLPNFNEQTCVRRIRLSDLTGWYLVVGCDHGTQDGKQAATLVAIKGPRNGAPEVRWLNETPEVEGFTKPEDDAQAIIVMLEERGLRYDDVDMWVGDVPTGSFRYQVKKSNNDLRREMALLLDRRLHQIKPFLTPKKGRNSMTYGVSFLNTLFGRKREDGTPHALVDPRCKRFIEFCNQFDGDKWHPTKDAGDSGRYPVERACGSVRVTT